MDPTENNVVKCSVANECVELSTVKRDDEFQSKMKKYKNTFPPPYVSGGKVDGMGPLYDKDLALMVQQDREKDGSSFLQVFSFCCYSKI
jgi:hypothetical protein